jgi:xanthine dehydrogenase accessory factor
MFNHILVIIKGGGDLASGVAYRLKRAGFPLIITELPAPMLVRRTICYGEAVYQGQCTVDGLTARRVDTIEQARQLAATATIPVLIDPTAEVIAALKPAVVIDAIMAKRNTGTTLAEAPLVIALGPGFTAGQDCHAVIETNRGHWLGRVITHGSAQADTGSPGEVRGHSTGRVLRAPAAGRLTPHARIGESIRQGQLIATVAGQELRAPFDGILRGLIHQNVTVTPGLKIGDLDPRGEVSHCFHHSDKSLAIGGGVLEAILSSPVITGESA